MVDGPCVHGEQPVGLENHHVQYRGWDLGTPTTYVEEPLVRQCAAVLFHQFFNLCKVLLEVSENDKVSQVQVYHDRPRGDTQHQESLADSHKSSLSLWDRVCGVWEM